QIHRQSLEAVGDLTRDRPAVEAAHLLEVGELGDLHAVQPYLPAETPRAQRRGLPVVLDEADVVHQRVEAERAQTPEIQIQDIEGRWLDDHLELIVVLQPERILAIAAIRGPARGLY